jgi:hypothetical protein
LLLDYDLERVLEIRIFQISSKDVFHNDYICLSYFLNILATWLSSKFTLHQYLHIRLNQYSLMILLLIFNSNDLAVIESGYSEQLIMAAYIFLHLCQFLSIRLNDHTLLRLNLKYFRLFDNSLAFERIV